MSMIFRYTPGSVLELETHTPPLPFGCYEYDNNNTDMLDKTGRPPSFRETQLEYVSQVSPIITMTPEVSRKADITILNNLSEAKSHGARVVHCLVEPQNEETSFEAIAKIYDPQYYLFYEFSNQPNHVVMQADMDYSREAAAYEYMSSSNNNLAQRFSPRYYGSWTFQRPVTEASSDQSGHMPVRLVLMEYFSQTSLRDRYYGPDPHFPLHKNALDHPEDFRLAILADVLDMAVRQRQIGLNQGDLAARNVILLEGDLEESALISRTRHYVLVDYNHSVVYPRSNMMHIFELPMEKPMNPLQVFWNDSLPGFDGWQPPEWAEQLELRHRWLYDTFGPKARKFDQYAPLVQLSKDEVAAFLADQILE